MELKEIIKVMQHYENGGEVEWTVRGSSSWGIIDSPLWTWSDFEYRIKEPKQKVTIEKWLLKDVNNGEHIIMESSDVDLYLKYALKWKKVKLLESYEIEL